MLNLMRNLDFLTILTKFRLRTDISGNDRFTPYFTQHIISGFFVSNFDKTFFNLVLHLFFFPII